MLNKIFKALYILKLQREAYIKKIDNAWQTSRVGELDLMIAKEQNIVDCETEKINYLAESTKREDREVKKEAEKNKSTAEANIKRINTLLTRLEQGNQSDQATLEANYKRIQFVKDNF